MKKLMAILLAVSLLVGIMSGCGGGESSAGESKTGSSSVQSSQAAEQNSSAAEGGETANDGETYEVLVAWMNFGSGAPDGMPEVEEAINEIVGPELGVSVRLLPIAAANMASEQNLMISSGEKLDLACTLGLGQFSSLVNSHAVIELDDLYEEYGVNLKQYCPDNTQYFGGSLYAIPVNFVRGNPYGFLGRKDIFDKYGFTPDKDKIYTYKEIGDMFQTIKDGEGDNFYMLANITSSTDLFTFMYPHHAPNGNACGGLIFDDSTDDWSQFTTFENIFASDEYKEYAELMYDWAQRGFISPDAGSNTDATETLMKSGNYLGQMWYGGDDAATAFTANSGYEIVSFQTQRPYKIGGSGIFWSVPVTSENPEKAFQFLDYLYGDNNIDGMLQFGLEGRDYEVVETSEDGDVLIKFPDGLDANTVPYYQIAGVFGDRLSWPILEPNKITLNKGLKEMEASTTLESPALDYVFDSTEYSSQITAIDAVINQYQGIITSGAIDPETELAEFNNALQAAGIDEVIAANQEQFDAYLAGK